MRPANVWIPIILTFACSCDVHTSQESASQERAIEAKFSFRDFRLGMTRLELYEILDNAKLSWVEELWKFDDNLYPGLGGAEVMFDDGWGIVPKPMTRDTNVTISAHDLLSHQRDARLIFFSVLFEGSKGYPESIIAACKEQYGTNPELKISDSDAVAGVFAQHDTALRVENYIWEDKRRDMSSLLQIFSRNDVPRDMGVKHGEKPNASSFHSVLHIIDHPHARDIVNEIVAEEQQRLDKQETQQQADLISGKKTDLPDTLPIERNPINAEPIIGKWVLRIRNQDDYTKETIGYFSLSRREESQNVVGSIVSIREHDISFEREIINGGLYEQDGNRFVILRATEKSSNMFLVGILTEDRIWGGGWYAYRAPSVYSEEDPPDFSEALVTQRVRYPGFPEQPMGTSSGIYEQCYVRLESFFTEDVGGTYPYHLYTGTLVKQTEESRIVNREPVKAYAIYKDGMLSIRGDRTKIYFTKITEDPILRLHGDPEKTGVFRDLFRGIRFKDVPDRPSIGIRSIELLVDGERASRDQIDRMYSNAVAAFGIMYAVPTENGEYFLLRTVGEPSRWEVSRVATINELGYVTNPSHLHLRNTRPIYSQFTASGIDKKDVKDLHIIYPSETVEAIRYAGLRKAGTPFTIRNILGVEPQIEYSSHNQKLRITARGVKTTPYYRW